MYEWVAVCWACVILCYAACYWRMRPCRKKEARGQMPETEGVLWSVVIPFRNEEEHLKQLIGSIHCALRGYDRRRVEFLFADDQSEDASVPVVERYAAGLPYRLLHSVPRSVSPKRDALQRGIGAARGRWILTLDADTLLPEGYFSRLEAAVSRRPEVSLWIGPLAFVQGKKDAAEAIQIYENLLLQRIIRTSASCGRPVLANGAHLLFRRDLFLQTGGYEAFPSTVSGDDVFLLLQWKKHFPGQTGLLPAEPALTVRTYPEATWRDFWRQHIRWARKTRLMKDRDVWQAALANVLLYGGYFAAMGFPAAWLAGTLLWWGLWWRSVAPLNRAYGYDFPWWRALAVHLIFPWIYLALAAGVWMPVSFRWKGRKYKI